MPVAMDTFASRIDNVILGALRNEIKKIAEAEIELAKENVERKIKERVGVIVMSVLEKYEVRNMRDRLVIEVKQEFRKEG